MVIATISPPECRIKLGLKETQSQQVISQFLSKSVASSSCSIKRFVDHHSVTFKLPKLWSCNDCKCLTGFRFQVSISNVTCTELESIQLREEHHSSDSIKRNNSTVGIICGGSRWVSKPDGPCLPAEVKFSIPNYVHIDPLMSMWDPCSFAHVLECLASLNLIHLFLQCILPQSVTICLI